MSMMKKKPVMTMMMSTETVMPLVSFMPMMDSMAPVMDYKDVDDVEQP